MSKDAKPRRRTEYAFNVPTVQVFAGGHDIEREAIELVFGCWNSGLFTRHMSPAAARELATSLNKAADHWDDARPAAEETPQ